VIFLLRLKSFGKVYSHRVWLTCPNVHG